MRGQRGPEVREIAGPVCLVRVENRRKRKNFPFKGRAQLLLQGREGAGRAQGGCHGGPGAGSCCSTEAEWRL